MEQSLEEIRKRNCRVELDKAWETSYTRRGIIALLTYTVALLWLHMIGNDTPFQSALIPFGGYLFSTWSIPFVKRWWIKKHDAI